MTQPSFNLLIDFEATGVNPKTARIMEVGAVLTNSEWDYIDSFEQLVYQPEHFPLTEEVKKVTGLTEGMLEEGGVSLRDMFTQLSGFLHRNGGVKYIIAYNREYDENLFAAEYERVYGKVPDPINWLCAMRDLEPNYKHKCWKLSHLALDHGVSVNPSELHRALADVKLMRNMLEKVGHTAQQMFEFQQQPWVVLQAMIPKPWEDQGRGKDEAIKRGYAWERLKGTDRVVEKSWVKQVKESQLSDEIKRSPFKVKVL